MASPINEADGGGGINIILPSVSMDLISDKKYSSDCWGMIISTSLKKE